MNQKTGRGDMCNTRG